MVGWADAVVSVLGSAASSAASTYVQNKGSSGAPSASQRTQSALTQNTGTERTAAANYRNTLTTDAIKGFVKEQPAAPIVANSNAAMALAAVLPDSSLKEFYTNMSRQQLQAQSQGPRQINV